MEEVHTLCWTGYPQRVLCCRGGQPTARSRLWSAKGLELSTGRMDLAGAHAEDAVVVEMTANTYLFYDTLLPHVHSVIAVHPPNVSLVTKWR